MLLRELGQEPGDESPGGVIVKQDTAKATFEQRTPAINAFQNVRRNIG
jgi:hypothetical protein